MKIIMLVFIVVGGIYFINRILNPELPWGPEMPTAMIVVVVATTAAFILSRLKGGDR